MNDEIYQSLLKKIPVKPVTTEDGKLYVRKRDGVIICTMRNKKSNRTNYHPVCTLCLEKHAHEPYDVMCTKVKMKQTNKGVKQGPYFFMCRKHQRVNDPRMSIVVEDMPDFSPSDLAKAEPKKFIVGRDYKCILCKTKKAQYNLEHLMCHGCFDDCVIMRECPKWILNLRSRKCCDVCGISKASTKPGEICDTCKKFYDFKPDAEFIKKVTKYAKFTRRSKHQLRVEAKLLKLI